MALKQASFLLLYLKLDKLNPYFFSGGVCHTNFARYTCKTNIFSLIMVECPQRNLEEVRGKVGQKFYVSSSNDKKTLQDVKHPLKNSHYNHIGVLFVMFCECVNKGNCGQMFAMVIHKVCIA